jgi:hypothetical protein
MADRAWPALELEEGAIAVWPPVTLYSAQFPVISCRSPESAGHRVVEVLAASPVMAICECPQDMKSK